MTDRSGFDQNNRNTLIALSNGGDRSIVELWADPLTHGLILSATLAGTALPISGATSGVGVAILDGSGNQITSFGGGSQYVDGAATPAHPTGTIPVFNNAGTITAVSNTNPLPVSATFSPSGTQDVNLTKIGGSAFALGQQLAAASVPIVLTASQITTLTPPAAITNFALETGGNLATIAGIIGSAGTALPGSYALVAMSDGSNTRPLRSSLGDASATNTVLGVSPMVFNGSTYDRSRTANSAATTTGSGLAGAGALIFDGTNWQKFPGTSTAATIAGSGTAGTPAGGVLSIQGVTSMTPIKVDGSGVTQPISGSVTVTQATGSNLHTVVDSGAITATLSAETTKVIGVVRTADGTGNLLTSTSNALDVNIKTSSITLSSNIAQVGGGTVSTTGVTGQLKVGIVDSLGNSTNSAANGFLKVTDEPRQVFYDSFDTALDTANYWTSTQGSSGVAASVSTGVMSMGTGTTANGYSKLASIPTFKPVIPGWVVYSDAIQIPDGGAPTSNAYRFWGCGTTPVTPTVSTPITDGYGFELTTAGVLRAVVYAGGTPTVIATGFSLNTSYHRYVIQVRTDRTFFYIDTIDSAGLVATTNFQSPQAQILPKLLLCIGNATPPASNSQILCTGAVVSDTGKNATFLADGSFPWRRQTVKAASTAAVATDLPAVVALHPSSPLPGFGKTIKTVTGTVSANTDIVAAVTSKRIKVIAYALFTSSTTLNTITMQSNATTALWTVPLLAPTNTSVFGANLAVEAPSFLFATAAGEKLTLNVSAAVNVTYSVSYFDDDAT